MNILITIIIPLFYGKKFVRHLEEMLIKNIRMLRNDSAYEVIFINDCPEEKIEIDDIIDDNIQVSVINHKENIGIHGSRVEGLNLAKGEFICFWDQDDDWSDDYLAEQLANIQSVDGVVCNGIYGQGAAIMNDTEDFNIVLDNVSYLCKLRGIMSPGQVMLRKSSVPDEWKKYILKTSYCDDAFLWVLMKDAGKKFNLCDKVLYTHRESDSNTSLNRMRNVEALEEMRRLIVDNNLLSETNREIVVKTISDRIYIQSLNYSIDLRLEKVQEQKERVLAFLYEKNIKRISLYGLGAVGKRVFDTLKSIGLDIVNVYDQSANMDEMKVKRMDEIDDNDDLMILCVLNGKEELLKKIQVGRKKAVAYIDDFLNECLLNS